jgi:hypothetical protein
MNIRHALLVAALLSGLPTLAVGYAFGTASPDGQTVQQNQVYGTPVIWGNPQQTLTLNFGGDYDTSAAVALGEWNAVGTAMQWSLGSVAAQPCNSGDHINSAGWSATTCDKAAFGDAIAVTKRSYEKIGDTWYFADADIVVDNSQYWDPHYDGPLRKDHTQDFRRVILHELGHALGLDHPDNAGQNVTAIMNSQISAIDSLQQDDKDGITALYAGITGSNTAFQSSSSGGGGSGAWLIPLLALAAWLRRKPYH